MRNKILDYLKSDRSFEAGAKLYMQYGRNIAFKNTLNRQGNTSFNLIILHEELRKLAGVSEVEFKALMRQPKSAQPKAEPVEPAPETVETENVQQETKTEEPAKAPVKKKAIASRKK